MGTIIESRDWLDVVTEASPNEPLGTSNGGQDIHEPLRGWAAFTATFNVMFHEERRKSLEFAKKRHIVLFPLMLMFVTTIATIGLQFLVGDSAAQSSDLESKTFSWSELRFGLHAPLLMFSLGMGTFAFMGREAIIQRTASKNYLLASPALLPLPNSTAHFAYFIKDLAFYVMLILSPIIFGMAVGLLLDGIGGVHTPLLGHHYPGRGWRW